MAGRVLRLAMLMTHYREPIDFSVRRLEEAEALWLRWGRVRREASDQDWQVLNQALSNPRPAASVAAALKDDLNSVAAFQAIHALTKASEAGDIDARTELLESLAFLGMGLLDAAIETHIPEIEIQVAVDERLAFIREKNWAEADRIRDELATQGIQLKDGKDTETGERVTTWEVKR
jgi:cysteinyl-tRNA synthetase